MTSIWIDSMATGNGGTTTIEAPTVADTGMDAAAWKESIAQQQEGGVMTPHGFPVTFDAKLHHPRAYMLGVAIHSLEEAIVEAKGTFKWRTSVKGRIIGLSVKCPTFKALLAAAGKENKAAVRGVEKMFLKDGFTLHASVTLYFRKGSIGTWQVMAPAQA